MKRPDAAAFEKVGPCSQPAAKGFRNANTVKVNRSRDAAAAGLPPELVDDLLRQHCHGMWGDSDDDQQDEKKSSQTSSLKCAIKEQPSGGGPGGKTLHRPLAQASPTCGVTDEGPTQKKQKVRASEALSSAQETGYLQLKSSDTPTQRHSMAVHANVAPARVLPPTPWQNSEKRRSHQRESKAKRQAKDLRKWSNMRACALRPILKSAPAGGQCPTKISCATAENGEVSRSLMTHNGLRDLSFVADPEDANFVPLAAQAEKRDDKHRKDQAEPAKDAKKEFDETVQDIRNMGGVLYIDLSKAGV